MASQQARRENVRRENVTDQVQGATDVHPAGPGAVHVKSTVTTIPDQGDQGTHPKKSNHGQETQPIMQQTQREKQQSSDVVTQGRKQQGFEERPGGVKFDVHSQEHTDFDTNGGTQMPKQSKGATEETKGPSLEEISQYRQTAQQNSMDAIRAAGERYEKAKEKGASTLHNVKESATHGLGATGTYATEKGAQAKDTITHGLQKAKDTALAKGQQAYEATKDTLSGAGQTAAQSAQQAKDYVAQKTGDTKDYTVQKTGEVKEYVAPKTGEVQEQGKGAASYVGEKATQVEDATLETGKGAASYVGEKATQVKDATLETGKGAVGYAGKVAEAVKDTAVVAGLGAVNLTAKAAAEATKATAGVVSSVAGYAGEKTVAAKDLVADAGKKTAGYAGDKLAAAKDYVVSAEESAAEYAARKKAEAERGIEAKKSHDTTKGESRGGPVSGEKQESKVEEFQPKERVEESFEEETGGKKSKQPEEGAVVVLHAIGETIMEIGKTTTDLVAGHRPSQTGDEP